MLASPSRSSSRQARARVRPQQKPARPAPRFPNSRAYLISMKNAAGQTTNRKLRTQLIERIILESLRHEPSGVTSIQGLRAFVGRNLSDTPDFRKAVENLMRRNKILRHSKEGLRRVA